ncbi:MAG: hypothetical protein V3U84_04165 [Thiotrichaceae bacterium]
MDALLDKISNLNYELFGLIFPGFLALLGVSYYVSIDYYAIREFPFSEFTTTYKLFREDYMLVLFIGLLTLSYLFGHILKWVSKEGIWKSLPPLGIIQSKLPEIETLWIRFLFLAGKTNPSKNHRSSFETLKGSLAKALSNKLSLDGMEDTLKNWGDFYFISKSYIGQSETKNLLANYQNKYTFHRSLASLFAILIWVSLASLIMFWFEDAPWFVYILIGVHTFFAYILLRHFVSSYMYFWRLFGDVVIAELAVELKEDS